MGYRKMSFGCLKVGMSDYNIPVVIPQNPTLDGDIFEFNSKYSLFFGTTKYPKGKITWIKPDNMPIFVADRVLLNKISYAHLVREGFATNGQIGGKVVHCNGVPFCCRLLDVGAERISGNPTAASEWDVCLHVTGDNNELWHWSRAGFWGTCATERKKHPVVVHFADLIRHTFGAIYPKHMKVKILGSGPYWSPCSRWRRVSTKKSRWTRRPFA